MYAAAVTLFSLVTHFSMSINLLLSYVISQKNVLSYVASKKEVKYISRQERCRATFLIISFAADARFVCE